MTKRDHIQQMRDGKIIFNTCKFCNLVVSAQACRMKKLLEVNCKRKATKSITAAPEQSNFPLSPASARSGGLQKSITAWIDRSRNDEREKLKNASLVPTCY